MAFLSYMIGDKQWWVRLFGWGISYKDLRRHPLIFSERNGYSKYLRIGPHCLKLLPRD